MNKLVPLFLVAMLMHGDAYAEDAPTPIQDSEVSSCLYQAKDSTAVLTCHQQAYSSADNELNVVYRQIRKQLSKTDKTALLNAQRAWLSYRDLNCQAESIQDLIKRQSCLTRMTKMRVEELRTAYFSEHLQASSEPEDFSHQNLLGAWKSTIPGYGLTLSFGVEDGVHYFASYLNNLPFEAGQWQLYNGKLSITASSNGDLLHYYQKLILDEQTQRLTLYEKDGSIETYQRMETP